MTVKETKLVTLVAKGLPKKRAYQQVYNSKGTDNTMSVEANRTLRKPEVKQALETALLNHQITLDKALLPISKGLSAVKVDDSGQMVEDLNLQLKASDRALKLLGVNSEQGNSLHLHLTDRSTNYNL